MTGVPAVSVIVPVFNGEGTLGALLSSLRGLVPHPLGGTEFIIVDNGSTDTSRQMAESAGIKGLRVVDEPRRGPAAARNRGLAEARGDLLALLDDDSVASRRWLRELVAPFSDPTVQIVAGGLASYPPRTGAQRFAARYGLNDATRAVEMQTMPFANTRNMAVRRSVAKAVGGWPEELIVGEDVEFSYRVRSRFGCAIDYRPAALVFDQDRETDEELWHQANGYGRSMADLYALHPDVLPWHWRQNLHRRRRSTQRRLAAAIGRLQRRLGRGDPEMIEFREYLAGWDRSFWRGFDDAGGAALRG